jgi:hypothetical protein
MDYPRAITTREYKARPVGTTRGIVSPNRAESRSDAAVLCIAVKSPSRSKFRRMAQPPTREPQSHSIREGRDLFVSDLVADRISSIRITTTSTLCT